MSRGERGVGGGEAQGILRTRDEDELFRQRYDRYPRWVISETQTVRSRAFPRPLTEVLGKAIKRLLKSEHGAWRGFVFKVENGDGMSWSAAAADRLIGESSALPRRRLIAEPRLDGFPQIVELIPKQRLIALAHETEVAPPLRALRRRSIVVAAIAVLVLGALVGALRALTAKWSGIDLLFPLAGATLGALLLVNEEASVRLRRSAREADEKRLREVLSEAPGTRPRAWRAFVEALSAELQKNKKDRAVVVDDFDRLDEITHDTLRHYLTHRGFPSTAHELWVVFESAEIATLSKDLHVSQRVAGRSALARIEVLRQRSLDEQARIKLAAEVGRPERADFHTVKSIVGYDADVADAYRKLFDGQHAAQRHDARAYGPLEVAYLLGVQHRTGAWGFSERELLSELSSEDSSAHREVLRLLLPEAAFSRGEVGESIERVKRELGRALDPERVGVGEIELVTEAAEVLVERRDRYGLPPADFVHLYWGLYWYSKLVGSPNVDAYRLLKLARHLSRAIVPGALEGQTSERVRERFQEALVWTAESLLAASLPGEVRVLLIRAGREARPDENSDRLRAACWQAYAVLGDEDMLEIILRLHPGSTPSPAAMAEPESLFIESLRSADAAPAVRRELFQRLLSLDRDVLAYAQVRGIWLALTIEPVVFGNWSHFREVVADSAPRAAALVGEALRSLEDPNHPRAAGLALTASLGTWCYALAFGWGGRELREANDLFEQVLSQAARLHEALEERQRQGKTGDYVLRAFANELEVVAGASSLLVSRSLAAIESPAEDQVALQDRIATAFGARLGSEGQLGAIKRQMDLQALTWRTLGASGERPLGFDQLVAFMMLRQAHLSAILENETRPVDEVLSDLAEQLDEPGAIGLMAHTMAMRESPSEEITGHLWVRAVGAAAGFGERLKTEVYLAALACCYAFDSIDVHGLAERLLNEGTTPRGGSVLSARLAKFDDEDRSLAALWLLNTAGASTVAAAVAEALLAEAKEVRDGAVDDDARDLIEQMIEIFELKRHLQEGQEVAEAEMLARWEHRRESPHYPWMLYLLVRPGADPVVLQAAADYLRSHPEAPTMSTPVSLAFDLAKFAGDGVPASARYRDVAFEYLDSVHPSMANVLGIETNIKILSALLRYGAGDPDAHRAGLERWEVARQERDAIKKLPELIEAGRFFLVFWHYYETLSFYGLMTEPEVSLGELTSREGEARALAEWRAEGETVPDPLVRKLEGVALSADFLRYGRVLFGQAAEDPDLDDARGVFNEVALGALPGLFDQLGSLHSLPDRVRSLLIDHQTQLFRGAAAGALSR